MRAKSVKAVRCSVFIVGFSTGVKGDFHLAFRRGDAKLPRILCVNCISNALDCKTFKRIYIKIMRRIYRFVIIIDASHRFLASSKRAIA